MPWKRGIVLINYDKGRMYSGIDSKFTKGHRAAYERP